MTRSIATYVALGAEFKCSAHRSGQWDTFRTLYPLMSLHDPENFARIVRGMINIQQHEGWLPECRGATVQHYIQGGSSKWRFPNC